MTIETLQKENKIYKKNDDLIKKTTLDPNDTY